MTHFAPFKVPGNACAAVALGLLLTGSVDARQTKQRGAASINYEETSLRLKGLGVSSSYTGSTVGAPRFARPSTSCTDSGGSQYRYHVREFSVDAAGTYAFSSIQDYDGYLHLYEASFFASDPTTNCLIGSDDGVSGVGSSDFDADLQPGVRYFLVTSSWASSGAGSFTNTIDGPGSVQLVDATIYSSTTVDGPSYDRPVNNCSSSDPGNGTSPYSVQPFRVDADGLYNFYSEQDYDGHLALYEASFDPANPLQGCLAENDDFSAVGDSGFASSLIAGTDYFLVTSAFCCGDAGAFRNQITGPGAVDFIAGGGAISGRITDLNGIAIDAGVDLYDDFGSYVASAAVVDGFYQFEGLAPGIYHVVAYDFFGDYRSEIFDDQPCCDFELATPVEIQSNGEITGIDFQLEVLPPAFVGTVTDEENGTAIANALIEIYENDSVFGFPNYVAGTYSDAAGEFQVSGLNSGSYLIVITADGFVSEVYDGIPCSGFCDPIVGTAIDFDGTATQSLDIMLGRGGQVTGRVLGADTAQGLLAELTVFDANGNWITSTFTNADGTYSVLGLVDGSYRVEARAGGYITERFDDAPCSSNCFGVGDLIAVTSGQATSGIDFTLDVGGSIAGLVTVEGSVDPVPFALVDVYDELGNYITTASADGFGQYLVDGLHSGSYRLNALAFGYQSEVYDNRPCDAFCDVFNGDPVSTIAGSTTSGVDFSLARTGSISGAIYDDSFGGIEYAEVYVFDASGAFVASALTDFFGFYYVQGLPDGDYFVQTAIDSFFYPGLIDQLYDGIPCPDQTCDPLTGTPITVADSNEVSSIDFYLGQGSQSLSGQVRDELFGLGLSDITVEVYDGTGQFVSVATTDVTGAYAIPGLPPGQFFLVARSFGEFASQLYQTAASCNICDPLLANPVFYDGVTPLSSLDFELALGGTISGSVTDAATGLPLSLVLVDIVNSSGAIIRTAETDGGGGYQAQGLAAEPVFVGTDASANASGNSYQDEMYEDIPCTLYIGSCDLAAGTALSPTPGGTTTVDFALGGFGSIAQPNLDVEIGEAGEMADDDELALQLGASATVGVAVENIGDLFSGPFDLTVYQSENRNPTPDFDVPIGMTSSTGLSAGQVASFSIGILPNNRDLPFILVCADVVIGEVAVGNNCDVANARFSLGPDLVAIEIDVEPESLIEGEPMQIDVTVQNAGDESSGPATLVYYRSDDDQIDPLDPTIGAADSLLSLPPGQRDSESQNALAPAAGTYWFGACTETTGETNIDNNCIVSGPHEVAEPPMPVGTATLVVTLLDGNDPARPGDSIRLDLQIENAGNAPIEGAEALLDQPEGLEFDRANIFINGGSDVSRSDSLIQVSFGEIVPGASVGFALPATVANAFPLVASEVTLQGQISGNNIATTLTDGDATTSDVEATVIGVDANPMLFALLDDFLLVDNDKDGMANPSDVIRYFLSLENTGNQAAGPIDVFLSAPTGLTIAPDRVRVRAGFDAEVRSGNTPGDTAIEVHIPSFEGGDATSRVLEFDLLVANDLSPALMGAAVQGELVVANATTMDIGTDDPRTAMPLDPTAIMFGPLAPVDASPSIADNAKFGAATASDDGTVAFGAPDDGAGTVTICKIVGGSNVCLTPMGPPDGSNAENFGASIDINKNKMIVGAPANSAGGKGGDGMAFLYEKNADGSWEYQTTLSSPDAPPGSGFGTSVGLGDDRGFVGAPGGNGGDGQVHVFPTDGTLAKGETIILPTPEQSADGNGGFGSSLAVGNGKLAIGMPGAIGASGMANLYDLIRANFSDPNVLRSAGASRFGRSLAIDGGVLVVGAPGSSQSRGAAYVYDVALSSASSNSFLGELPAADGFAGDDFGASVAIAGNEILVGAPNALTSVSDVYAAPGSSPEGQSESAQLGAAYRYETTAESNAIVIMSSQKLGAFAGNDAGTERQSEFGASVALADGVAVIGAPGGETGRGSGAVRVSATRPVFDDGFEQPGSDSTRRNQ